MICVSWRNRKAFIADLKAIYKAATREEAEANLVRLEETWDGKYGAAVRSWQKQLGGAIHFLCFSPGSPPIDLHYQFRGGLPSATAKGNQE
ncbi:MAG: transposase [Anaerolineaceae bacterium]|nr:transposase [Anaerolineaceae bacterium]